MRIFIVNVRSYFTTKNKANEELQEHIKTIDRTVLYGFLEVESFYEELRRKVQKVNEEYRRCQDIHISRYKTNVHRFLTYGNTQAFKDDQVITVANNFTMHILAGKETD